MTASDLYGYTYVDKDGNPHIYNERDGIPVIDWVLSYYYSEDDGWSFMHKRRPTEIKASINKNCPPDLVKVVLEKCREKIGKEESSKFEKIIENELNR